MVTQNVFIWEVILGSKDREVGREVNKDVPSRKLLLWATRAESLQRTLEDIAECIAVLPTEQ